MDKHADDRSSGIAIPIRFLIPCFVICTCIKILLVLPTYRSTDFDVHRNWLAVTKQLPLSQWYYDDINGTTVHTLDYPPNFAYFEWMLSHLPNVMGEGERCFERLPDADNAPSDDCVVFQRTTVIISDIVLWIGAAVACSALSKSFRVTPFLLIVFNPGLLWLDHIHFQYNGMMLGILLFSLGLLLHHANDNGDSNISNSSGNCNIYPLGGAIAYATLLNFKHLYLPLAPLYFLHLWTKYCMTQDSRMRWTNLMVLGIVTLATLVVPWIPFVWVDGTRQIEQILKRLFPFQRGLVHDYWAANVWALYQLADKVYTFVQRRSSSSDIQELPDVPPLVCAGLLFVSLLPALIQNATTRRANTKLLQSVVYCSMCAFMLAYHVHEKAIMTAMIPLALLTTPSSAMVETSSSQQFMNLLFWQVSLWGLVGLLPLLFDSYELAFKLSSFVTYMVMSTITLSVSRAGRMLQLLSTCVACLVIIMLEFVTIRNGLEFMPLMVTSTVCAVGLVACWISSLYVLLT